MKLVQDKKLRVEVSLTFFSLVFGYDEMYLGTRYCPYFGC